MALFQKKKEQDSPEQTKGPAPALEPAPTAPTPDSGIPVDQVMNLRQQGLTNNQIIQTLQRDGFNSGQIFDALNQADIQGGSAGPIPDSSPSDAAEMPPPDQGAPQMEAPQGMQPPGMQSPGMQSPGMQSPGMQPQGMPPLGMPPMGQGSMDRNQIEELTEAIINEKWEQLLKNLSKLTEWKDKTEHRLTKLEQEFADLNKNFTSLQQGVLGKISEYDQNIINVGTEVKAMEKVFQKLIPTFTENVNELSRITRNSKKK